MTDSPRFWNTNPPDKTTSGQNVDFRVDRPPLDYIHEFRRHDPAERDQAPDYIFFNLSGLREDYKRKLPDIFTITGGLIVISERFADLLRGFELGQTRLFEVPLFERDQKTPRPGRWFILHIAAKKSAFVPEASSGVKEKDHAPPGLWEPDRLVKTDVVAVRASAAEGEDLWVDTHYSWRIFFSDRLRQAIKEAGIKGSNFVLRPCIVVD